MDRIQWLYDLQHFGIKLGLDNIRALLQLLDRPQSAFPCVIVGGTNGKGSVTAMLHAMLNDSGVPAGMFTSPHLVRPHERIRLEHEDIDDPTLQRILGEVRERVERAVVGGELLSHPSFFEVMTATALIAFREQRLDACVLEVGLGGRLDATNAVDADLSVIVSVDLDHTKTLGDTLAAIATEKAGIIKPGKPVIHGVSQPEALGVLQRVARERNAELIDGFDRVRLIDEAGPRFSLRSSRARYDGVELSLAGRHQIGNARIAIAAFEVFCEHHGIGLDPQAVRQALAGVRWAGRLQWIRDREGWPAMLFDGAHNPSGMGTLADYLATLREPKPVALLGVMRGKLVREMLDLLLPHVERMVLTRPNVSRAADPEEFRDCVRLPADRVEVVDEPAAALERARALCDGRRPLLVTGSLYLIGEILGILEGRRTPGPVSM